VPKPPLTYSLRVISKWKGEAAFLPRLNPWVSCRRGYETGQTDGKAQYEMDKRANSIREGELLSWTAVDKLMKLDQALDNISQVQYACGFVEGYLVAEFAVPA
jgi:hypothetical protein